MHYYLEECWKTCQREKTESHPQEIFQNSKGIVLKNTRFYVKKPVETEMETRRVVRMVIKNKKEKIDDSKKKNKINIFLNTIKKSNPWSRLSQRLS